ncbi:hypothetical protein CCACVL1_29118, partial [Corchorus capsularis]
MYLCSNLLCLISKTNEIIHVLYAIFKFILCDLVFPQAGEFNGEEFKVKKEMHLKESS